MRVKTVPRQRMIRHKKHVESDCFTVNREQSEDSSSSEGEETEKRPAGMQPFADKCKAQPLRTSLLTHREADGPFCRKHNFNCESRERRVFNENNSISVLSNGYSGHGYPGAGPSTGRPDASGSAAPSSPRREDVPAEAMNLCTKDQPEPAAQRPASVEDRVKESFLYKMMTDPAFLESVQRSKQTRRHVCPFCKQSFQSGDQLTSHMDVKRDEADQVVCCACRKTFAKTRYLRYHQRCHAERTKFSCELCTKKYTRLDNLTRHNAFHVNPDKFACPSCEKTFARKDLLNKHQRCHDNKYRFYCEACRKYFKGPLTLENHKKIVHSVG